MELQFFMECFLIFVYNNGKIHITVYKLFRSIFTRIILVTRISFYWYSSTRSYRYVRLWMHYAVFWFTCKDTCVELDHCPPVILSCFLTTFCWPSPHFFLCCFSYATPSLALPCFFSLLHTHSPSSMTGDNYKINGAGLPALRLPLKP